ncbi:MAG: CRTAC1 family protein, partial [Paracoccaceae bacterium]
STGWHTQFADLNNDGRLDLFIAKGNVERMPEFSAVDPDNLLLGLADGTFSEQGGAAGIALARRGRGAVIEDFNADGMLDLLVVNREEPVSLFRNLGKAIDGGFAPVGNFLAVELDNGAINPNAIGAKISVTALGVVQTHTVQIGGGHASVQLGFEHFGLAGAQRAQVRVKWPGQDWSRPYQVTANSFVVITRGAADVKYWQPQQAR